MVKKSAAKTATPARKVESVSGSDLPTYYVNNVSIDISTFDVRMKLGQIQGATESVLQIKDVAYVFMSHSHFRALAGAIATSIAQMDKMIQAPRSEDKSTH